MKIKATITMNSSMGGSIIDIPESEVRRLRGEGEEQELIIPDFPNCPECGSNAWHEHDNTCTIVCSHCGREVREDEFPILKAQFNKPPEAPPVEGSLARARELYAKLHLGHNRLCDLTADWQIVGELRNAYEAAIRERDERAAQMMTVEEFEAWRSTWGSNGQPNETFGAYLRRRIKERNEGAK